MPVANLGPNPRQLRFESCPLEEEPGIPAWRRPPRAASAFCVPTLRPLLRWGPVQAAPRVLPRPQPCSARPRAAPARSTRPAPLLGAQTRAHPRRPRARPRSALRQAVPGGGARLSPKAGIVPGAAAPAAQGRPASPRGRVFSSVLGRAAACVRGPRASLVSAVAMSQRARVSVRRRK